MKQTSAMNIVKFCSLLAILLSLSLLTGCVTKNFGTTMGHKIQGDFYLQYKQYDKGAAHFKDEVAQNPESASARYYYGRFLLQNNHNQAALTQLKKARDLDPINPVYHFWTGIAYGENGNTKKEAESYETALQMDPRHLQSRIYLAHNLLKRKKYTASLQHYEVALGIWPYSPSSLYNRALILRKLGRTPEEKKGWHTYLYNYPTGALALKAVTHLNSLGDYSYRNHHLGTRTVTVEKINFVPVTNEIERRSQFFLHNIGEVFVKQQKGTLQIVAYQKNNKELAKKKALVVKKYLLDEFPKLEAKQIGVSWFDKPQTIVVDKRKHRIDESISFFIASAG